MTTTSYQWSSTLIKKFEIIALIKGLFIHVLGRVIQDFRAEINVPTCSLTLATKQLEGMSLSWNPTQVNNRWNRLAIYGSEKNCLSGNLKGVEVSLLDWYQYWLFHAQADQMCV